MKLAFIGSGQVGAVLADNLVRAGHEVVLAARDPGSESVRAALARQPRLAVAAPAAAVAAADVVFLATPYAANATALGGLDLRGKVLVDCTNPVGPGLSHGLESRTSGAETVQRLAPGARVVRAFTIYGWENFANSTYPGYGDLKPVMLLTGDDAAANTQVGEMCRALGWEPLDCGPLANALHLEHLTLLWIKLARAQGRGPDFVWAVLRR